MKMYRVIGTHWQWLPYRYNCYVLTRQAPVQYCGNLKWGYWHWQWVLK